MKLIYSDEKTKSYCTSLKAACKLFGGNKQLAISLIARINALEQACVIKDIIVMPTFHFHKLKGDWNGYFAIDVKSRRDKWRIILCPLDEKEQKFHPCNIDEIAEVVQIIEIREVSAHYE
ncbi:MAG: type II toxin-antitoxin system RelE/ParE family toxin [Lachnospiraceae bacterium]|nr:type II toxin-antitoxin system RelE/ParE family toxin [Lachnospiraceae bacterium]